VSGSAAKRRKKAKKLSAAGPESGPLLFQSERKRLGEREGARYWSHHNFGTMLRAMLRAPMVRWREIARPALPLLATCAGPPPVLTNPLNAFNSAQN
jgi:hypothetical protein